MTPRTPDPTATMESRHRPGGVGSVRRPCLFFPQLFVASIVVINFILRYECDGLVEEKKIITSSLSHQERCWAKEKGGAPPQYPKIHVVNSGIVSLDVC